MDNVTSPLTSYVRAALVLFGLEGLVTTWYLTGLTYDGSYFGYVILRNHQLFVDHQRYSEVVFELPVVLAARLATDMAVLRPLFCLPYALVPVISVALSWLVVRRQNPGLIIWPILGIGLVSVPGLALPTAEAVITAELAWPVLLAVAIGMPRRTWLVVLLVAPLILFLHPISAAPLAMAAMIAVVVAIQEPARRTTLLILSGACLVAAAVRLLAPLDSYEQSVLTSQDLLLEFGYVGRSSIFAVVVAWVLGIMVVLDKGRRFPRITRYSAAIAATALVVATVLLVRWAANPTGWSATIHYRDFDLLFEIPLFLLMAVNARGRAGTLSPSYPANAARRTGRLVLAVSLVFTLVLAVNALQWGTLTRDLERRMTADPGYCGSPVPAGQRNTALDHWSVPYLANLLRATDQAGLLRRCRPVAS